MKGGAERGPGEPQPRWAGFLWEARGSWGAVGPLASSALPAVVTHPVPGPHVPRGRRWLSSSRPTALRSVSKLGRESRKGALSPEESRSEAPRAEDWGVGWSGARRPRLSAALPRPPAWATEGDAEPGAWPVPASTVTLESGSSCCRTIKLIVLMKQTSWQRTLYFELKWD